MSRTSKKFQLLRALLFGSAITTWACQDRSAADAYHVETVGDTTFVDIAQTSQGRTGTLTEDLRISSAAGEEFGMPGDLAVGPDGSLLVHDMQADQVYHFDNQGRFLRKIGRPGSGPGEYRTVNGLAVARSDGTIYVREPRKIVAYSPQGAFRTEWPIASSLMQQRALSVSPDGSLALKVLLAIPAPFADLNIGFLRISPNGAIVDTIRPPTTPWDSESQSHQSTHPHRHFEWSSDGFGVAAVSSRLAFQVVDSGKVLIVERHAERVPFQPDERAQWNAHYEWLRNRWGDAGRNILPTPEFKPAFHYMGVARTGEIWLRRSVLSEMPSAHRVESVQGLMTPPVWDEPLALDVFGRDGRLLRTLNGPVGITVKLLSSDTVWGYWVSDDGVRHLVRYTSSPE